ncbi:MAG: flavoprotein, partial [Candidatus Methanomethylophilaceae archaeon]
MNKNKLCVVFTGTVASTLAPKICEAFQNDFEVTTVFTKKALYFYNPFRSMNSETPFCDSYLDDETEWKGLPVGGYVKQQEIPHVDLATQNDVLLIIASADFLAKMTNGICDDLASSLYRAWRRHRPVIVAPAMNSYMWNHPVTQEHLNTLKSWNVNIVYPQEKMLACGEVGMGALAEIQFIKEIVDKSIKPIFPLDINDCSGIPVGKDHPGSFLGKRKFAPHTGVDLYCNNSTPVFCMAPGVVVSVEDFTGTGDNSTWWEDTKCVLIRHSFGTVCYGEIEPAFGIKEGLEVSCGSIIGNVKRVLKPGKERPDIPGHKTSMLHIELYPVEQKTASKSYEQDKEVLRNPTDMLIKAWGENPV